MYRKTSKLRKRAELTLIYSIMVLAVVAGVAVLVLVMQGYRFNRYDGKIEQGGLLQYDSQPDGGTVYVDSLKLANQTPNKITVSAGDHTVKMTKAGYVDWKKDVSVDAGSILWLNYTRFIPVDRTALPQISLTAASSAAYSRDKKRLLVKEFPESPEVSLITLDTDKPERMVIPFDEASYTKPTDAASMSFAVEEWDRDNRYALIRYQYDGKLEWLVLDTRDKKIIKNVTTSSTLDIASAAFVYGNNRALYVLTASAEVRRIDLGSDAVSAPLLSSVQEFSQYDRSTLVYTSLADPTTKSRHVGYLTNGAKKPRVLVSYADDGQVVLHLRIGRYFNETYAAISYGETLNIMRGDLPSSDAEDASMMKQVASVNVPGGASNLDFSPEENRYVYAYNGSRIVTYDLELSNVSTTEFVAPLTGPLRWIDRYHFVTTVGARAMLYEFDGQNPTEIMSGVLPLAADFTSNSKYFYAFVTADAKTTLSRVRIEL